MARMTRSLISAAALIVKVIATIDSGRLTTLRRPKIRWTNKPVLPEPAGACTMKDSSGLRACWRLASSETPELIGTVFVFTRLPPFLYAAQRLQIAISASSRLGINNSIARHEFSSDGLKIMSRRISHFLPIQLRPFGAWKMVVRGGSYNFQLTRPHLGYEYAVHRLIYGSRINQQLRFRWTL